MSFLVHAGAGYGIHSKCIGLGRDLDNRGEVILYCCNSLGAIIRSERTCKTNYAAYIVMADVIVVGASEIAVVG